MHILDQLNQIIGERASDSSEKSYTASLLQKGNDKCVQKFGEEAIELTIAATKQDKEEMMNESADLLYHWLVMLKSSGLDPKDVYETLAKRQNISGLDEKASRSK